MADDEDRILSSVARYYSDKLAEFGKTARGVDWNGEESQQLRFDMLSSVLPSHGEFSVNDLGCGYGAFLDYLADRYVGFSYAGIDVSAEMIAAAKEKFDAIAKTSFYCSSEPTAPADFGIASGIFNVRLQSSDADWLAYVERTIAILDATSAKGFSFNCLTSYSDAAKKRDYLYYAEPGYMFDLCKRKYSRNVALLHDYGLYEFTVIVRKS